MIDFVRWSFVPRVYSFVGTCKFDSAEIILIENEYLGRSRKYLVTLFLLVNVYQSSFFKYHDCSVVANWKNFSEIMRIYRTYFVSSIASLTSSKCNRFYDCFIDYIVGFWSRNVEIPLLSLLTADRMRVLCGDYSIPVLLFSCMLNFTGTERENWATGIRENR